MLQLRLFLAGSWLATRVPPGPLYALAGLVGSLLARLPLRAGRQARKNLARVLGLDSGSSQLPPLVRRVFRAQARNYVDLLRGDTIPAQEVGALFCSDGLDLLERALAEKRGAILITAHLGRVELLRHLLSNRGIGLTLVVERLQPPELFDLISRLRQRPGFALVPHDSALRPCLRALGRGELVVFFADWDPTMQGVPVTFFGAPARLPAGPAFLALRSGVPVFCGFGLPAEAGMKQKPLRARVEPLLQGEPTGDQQVDTERLTQRIAAALEGAIQQAPGEWVMFHEIWPAV